MTVPYVLHASHVLVLYGPQMWALTKTHPEEHVSLIITSQAFSERPSPRPAVVLKHISHHYHYARYKDGKRRAWCSGCTMIKNALHITDHPEEWLKLLDGTGWRVAQIRADLMTYWLSGGNAKRLRRLNRLEYTPCQLDPMTGARFGTPKITLRHIEPG